MTLVRRLLLVTFIESFATTCVERGVYFFSQTQLKFSDSANLWLALAFGVAYCVGALFSHPVSKVLKEGPLLALSIFGQLLMHIGLVFYCDSAATLILFTTLLGALNGIKWPVLESYVSAGLGTRAQAASVGRYNVSWALAVPTALAATGPILHLLPQGIFVLPAALNFLSMALIRPLPVRPLHVPDDHPERPGAGEMPRIASLLVASRWLMLGSYAALWILAALMPAIFKKLAVPAEVATACSGLVDVARVLSFVVFQRYVGWHGRSWPLFLSLLCLPSGFFMVLFGQDLTIVMAGEVIFGFAAGLTYYGALYYAMLAKNASVDAGGAHEGLIGAGFALGPAMGLVGTALVPVFHSRVIGTVVGVAPLFLLCGIGVALALAGKKIAKV